MNSESAQLSCFCTIHRPLCTLAADHDEEIHADQGKILVNPRPEGGGRQGGLAPLLLTWVPRWDEILASGGSAFPPCPIAPLRAWPASERWPVRFHRAQGQEASSWEESQLFEPTPSSCGDGPPPSIRLLGPPNRSRSRYKCSMRGAPPWRDRPAEGEEPPPPHAKSAAVLAAETGTG
jgi:hypothetical protein